MDSQELYRIMAFFKVECERIAGGKYKTPSALNELFVDPIPEELYEFALMFSDMSNRIQKRETVNAKRLARLESDMAAAREEKEELLQRVEQLETELEDGTVLDPLTGLPNRKRLDEQYKFEIMRVKRNNTAFACLMLDLDHFAQINQQFGEQRGDQLLREIARLVKNDMRKDDFVGRLGGGEMLILAPATTREGMELVGERLRSAVERLSVNTPQGAMKTTISVGIAIHFPGERQPETLYRRASKALYEAKIEGRNRVAFAAQNPRIG